MKIPIYSRNVFNFYFAYIVVALTSSTHASLTLALAMHQSIATVIYYFHFAIISSPFLSLLVPFKYLFQFIPKF